MIRISEDFSNKDYDRIWQENEDKTELSILEDFIDEGESTIIKTTPETKKLAEQESKIGSIFSEIARGIAIGIDERISKGEVK